MFVGIAIFASVVLWLMVKEKGFRKVVFIGAGIIAVIGVCVAIWHYAIQLPAETRKANAETAKQEAATKYTIESPSPEEVKVRGPDGKLYSFPAGTTKDFAIAYFKKKGIGGKEPDGYLKKSTIVYHESDLSGRAVGSAELNDMVKIVARDSVYSTLRIRDVHNGFEGWVPEANVVFVTVKPAVGNGELPPCPANDPLGVLDGGKLCKPPSPKGAPPCPANDPAGLYTSAPCAPPPQ